METPVNISGHGEVRYKLIIDPSEDNSLIRYMFTFGILRMENTRVHMCSNLGDSHLEKVCDDLLLLEYSYILQHHTAKIGNLWYRCSSILILRFVLWSVVCVYGLV